MVVVSVGKGCVKVDKCGDFFRVAASDGTQLFASDRMSGEDGLLQFEGADDGKNIVAETVGGVVVGVWGDGAGIAEPATGDAIDVMRACRGATGAQDVCE